MSEPNDDIVAALAKEVGDLMATLQAAGTKHIDALALADDEERYVVFRDALIMCLCDLMVAACANDISLKDEVLRAVGAIVTLGVEVHINEEASP